MTGPVSVTRNGRRTFLKWHRARRRAADPVFTGRRILEGMALGASVEVDLVLHADDGFAVLHNLDLGPETTGHGPVRDTPAATLRALHLRGNDGRPIADRVMLLEDLAALLARDGAHPAALLQLDYKEDAAALSPSAIATFAAALAPVARHFILSSGDADAVALLTDQFPASNREHLPAHLNGCRRRGTQVAEPVRVVPRARRCPPDHVASLVPEVAHARRARETAAPPRRGEHQHAIGTATQSLR